MDEVANLVDIDLSQFAIADTPEVPVEEAVVEPNEPVDETSSEDDSSELEENKPEKEGEDVLETSD
jgi:hypothetical protein